MDKRQWWNSKDLLACDAQRLAAGGDDLQPGRRLTQLAHQIGASADQMFTVVENQQQLARHHMLKQGLHRRLSWLNRYRQCCADCLG